MLSVPLLPVALYTLPRSLRTPFTVSPLLFIASFSILFNFPNAVPSLQKRPLYLQDIVVEDESAVASLHLEIWKRKRAYYHACRLMVNITSAMLIAGFCEYGYTLWKKEDNPGYMEVAGVVGGVLALLNRTQSIASRILLKLCHLAQDWDERRRRVVEMTLHGASESALMTPTNSVHEELNTYFLGVV